MALEVHPKAGGGAEIGGEAQGGVRRDNPFAADYFIYPAGRHFDRPAEGVLCDSRRFHELFHKNLAGGYRGHYLGHKFVFLYSHSVPVLRYNF